MDQFDREEASIEKSFDRGEIDSGQRSHGLQELARDYRAHVEEESQRAYADRICDPSGGW